GVVDDRTDMEAGRLDGPDRLLAARAGRADDDVHLRDAHVLGLARRVGGGELGGVRGALLGALVADRAGRGPGHRVAVHVGDRDDRVVVRGVDERLAFREVTLDALLRGLGVATSLSHAASASLLRRLLLASHGAARALARPGVRLRGLAPHREAAAVPQAAVAADVHEPLDVELPLTAQVALDLVLAVDDLTEAADLDLGQVLDPRVGVDLSLGEDVLRARPADTVDVRERRFDPLLAREVDTCDPSHPSPLPLLVLRVHAADHVHPSVPAYHLALVAHRLN